MAKTILKKRLPRSFYLRPTLKIAPDLLGKVVVRKIDSKFLTAKIVETEAYIGPKDKASHAYRNRRTQRNEAEYLEGGHVYIYLIYGRYWQLNIVTAAQNRPECILIRALEPIDIGGDKPEDKILKDKRKTSYGLTNGPGRLCRWLQLDKSFYGEDLSQSKRLWLEDWHYMINSAQIVKTARIGIDYAGAWAKKPWRFYIKDNPWVSRQ